MNPSLVRSALRLLSFRMSAQEFATLDHRHLRFGLVCTWIVGMGRWWDDPRANLAQHLGLGSLLYIFVLAALLWLVVWPLAAEGWSYCHTLTFVSLTSPPALLYAIPVEMWTSLPTAQAINVWFLGVVAVWRVNLLFFYLKRHAGLTTFSMLVVALLPITLIIVALAALNLERAVFDFMGGLRRPRTANDEAYGIVVLLSMLSALLFLPLLISYGTLILLKARQKAKQAAAASTHSAEPRPGRT